MVFRIVLLNVVGSSFSKSTFAAVEKEGKQRAIQKELDMLGTDIFQDVDYLLSDPFWRNRERPKNICSFLWIHWIGTGTFSKVRIIFYLILFSGIGKGQKTYIVSSCFVWIHWIGIGAFSKSLLIFYLIPLPGSTTGKNNSELVLLCMFGSIHYLLSDPFAERPIWYPSVCAATRWRFPRPTLRRRRPLRRPWGNTVQWFLGNGARRFFSELFFLKRLASCTRKQHLPLFCKKNIYIYDQRSRYIVYYEKNQEGQQKHVNHVPPELVLYIYSKM